MKLPRASEMKALAEDINQSTFHNEIEVIAAKITKTAEAGDFSIELLESEFKTLTQIKDHLREMGYTLGNTTHTAGTQWDPYDAPYLVISW